MNATVMLSLLAVLILAPVGMVQAAPDPVPAGITHEATIYDETLDQTTFWYNIWPSTPAASHVVLGICGIPLSVSWTPNSRGYDPTTEMSGLKLDNLPDLTEPLSVSIVMAGKYSDQSIAWKLKAGTLKDGQQIKSGTTLGPACGPNAVALSGLSAEGVDAGLLLGYGAALIVALIVGVLIGMWLRRSVIGK